jgi:hypothetical protein
VKLPINDGHSLAMISGDTIAHDEQENWVSTNQHCVFGFIGILVGQGRA